ncbi:deoxyribose-phosphate aldolase [bacterium]|nr:deoxyribose-phosphate aldolase [bacterium]
MTQTETPRPGQCEICIGCGMCVQYNPEAVTALVVAGASRIGAYPGATPASNDIAKLIDHTLLKPEASKEEILKVCEEALEFGFASVCVNPFWVRLCAEHLRGSEVKVCSVVGFPLGATQSSVKRFETEQVIKDGANEIDMVINIGALKSNDLEYVRDDIAGIVDVCQPNLTLKVIIETALLSDEEKIKACVAAKVAGADFVKTSTGFSKGGATVEDVALMKRVVGSEMGVKASGGIRDYEKALEMVQSGASRIGASSSVEIVKKE